MWETPDNIKRIRAAPIGMVVETAKAEDSGIDRAAWLTLFDTAWARLGIAEAMEVWHHRRKASPRCAGIDAAVKYLAHKQSA